MRCWMDLFGDWIATKNGMLDTLLAMIESGEIAHAQPRSEPLAAITTIPDAGRAAGDLRSDVTAEDVAASLIGIFTVAPRREHEAKAGRLLDLLMDGLRPPARPAR
ncbi:SbtR family transcriptional regulator [Nonomuraea sp. NPDC001684]